MSFYPGASRPDAFYIFLCSSFLLEERCRFLSHFTTATAEVELPGEFLIPKSNTVSNLAENRSSDCY